MRNPLQSKTAVSVFCAVAVLCVLANFVDLPARKTIQVAARATADGQKEVPALDFDVPPPLRIRRELGAWRNLFPNEALSRDPFALVPEKLPPPVSANAPPAVPLFTLHGVSLEPGRALAVINHRIVAPGDRVEDYVVERIERMEVWLKGAAGRVIVPLNPAGSTGKKSASGPSIPADLSPGGPVLRPGPTEH